MADTPSPTNNFVLPLNSVNTFKQICCKSRPWSPLQFGIQQISQKFILNIIWHEIVICKLKALASEPLKCYATNMQLLSNNNGRSSAVKYLFFTTQFSKYYYLVAGAFWWCMICLSRHSSRLHRAFCSVENN